MKDDLISRSELKKEVDDLYDETLDGIVKFGIEEVYKLIDNAPTVEQKEFEQILQPIKVNIPDDIKDRLIEELSKPRKVIPDESKTVTDCMIAYGDGFESARRLFERPHGEWKITDGYPHKVYCDKCFKTYAQENWEVWKDGSLSRNFCPNCGADMRKGEEE